MDSSPDDREKQFLKYVKEGPISATQHRFEEILTIPKGLEAQLQLWDDEIEICDQAICVGKALDAIIHTHEELLAQFSRITDLRNRFYHAPNKYTIVEIYYCDRALSGLLSSIVKVRMHLTALYDELKTLCTACMNVRNSAQKAYRVFEDSVRKRALDDPSFRDCVENAKLKAMVLRELGNRISSIALGGNSMLKYLHCSWTSHDLETTARQGLTEKPEETPQTEQRQEISAAKPNSSVGKQTRAQPEFRKRASAGNDVCPSTSKEVPETPEGDCVEAFVKTQRSSPKKKPLLTHSQKRQRESEKERRVVVAKKLRLGTPSRNMGSTPAKSSIQAHVTNPATQDEGKEKDDQEGLILPSSQSRDQLPNHGEEQYPPGLEYRGDSFNNNRGGGGDNPHLLQNDLSLSESSKDVCYSMNSAQQRTRHKIGVVPPSPTQKDVGLHTAVDI